VTQGPTGGPRVVESYIVGHYRLEVANDVFNDGVRLILSSYHATLGQQRGTMLSDCPTL
jgi:hypothetical protein